MMKRIVAKVLVGLVSLALVTEVAYAQADDDDSAVPYSCGKAKGRVTVSFSKPEVEVKDLITWAMGFTCRNFVYGPGIASRQSKVVIIVPKEMSVGDAWRLFQTALQTMNLTIVPKGRVLKIVETSKSKKETLPMYVKGRPPTASTMVRMVMRPEHIPVDEASKALGAVVSADGVVTALPSAGLLIITDYGDSISKMRQLMREIDEPNQGERFYMIRVRHGDAQEIATKLTEMLGVNESQSSPAPARRNTRRGRRGGRSTPAAPTENAVAAAIPKRIIPEDRTNSLIVVGSEAAYYRVKALVDRIDIPLEGVGGGRVHVYYLDNADAEEMANTLTSVITGVQQASQQQNQRSGNNRRVRRPTPSSSSSSSAPAFEGEVNVAFDKPTNSLVIIASVRDFHALRDVIRKLDIPRKQVFIEALIFEVSMGSTLNIGSSFHGGASLNDGLLVGGLQGSDGDLQSLNVLSIAAQSGLIGGLIGPILPEATNLIGRDIPSYGVLFQALAGTESVNVLSAPHLLTTDNEEAAEIAIGDNVPYIGGLSNSFPGQAGNVATLLPQQNIQRQDIELNLKITPQISQSGQVRMQIEMKMSDLGTTNFGDLNLGPSWTKRELKTTASVKDQETVVLGGLVSTRETVNETKIPILGDIPVLGSLLFKQRNTGTSKKNLLVMITPHVIENHAQLREIRMRKDRERVEFVRANSNFEVSLYKENVDYRKKRGLVEEIVSTARRVKRERRELEELDRMRVEFPDGPIEYKPKARPDPKNSEDAGKDGGEDSKAKGDKDKNDSKDDANDKESEEKSN